MSTNTSVALVPIDRCFADGEELALAGFLAGYRGSTREAYALDVRQFVVWCANHERRLFDVHRVDIECFGRELEACGRARATIARRLCTIAGFFRYAEEEGLIAANPRCRDGPTWPNASLPARVRRPLSRHSLPLTAETMRAWSFRSPSRASS
jgi:integrase